VAAIIVPALTQHTPSASWERKGIFHSDNKDKLKKENKKNLGKGRKMKR